MANILLSYSVKTRKLHWKGILCETHSKNCETTIALRLTSSCFFMWIPQKACIILKAYWCFCVCVLLVCMLTYQRQLLASQAHVGVIARNIFRRKNLQALYKCNAQRRAVTVSYTHLDVYKRQDLEQIRVVFCKKKWYRTV